MQMNQVAGDAFLLFIQDLATSQVDAEQRAAAIANEIRCTISRPFFTENGEVIVTASVGISVLVANSDTQSMTASEAIQQAESAMFEAKRRGRDAVMLFDTQITRRAQQRINLQSSLRKAVVNQEFDLYLQPQVSIHDGSVVGGEVLLR
jgi:predicted signal transduction protein with EAL and GGDEF domain